MTAEKQYVDDFESAYQGKTWTKGKVFGIMAVVCIAMVIRDIGMALIYGSIYDKIALEGPDASVSFLNYVFMVLLFALPLVLPMILRFTNGAYDNEIESPLFPSFNSKSANIVMYVVVGLVCIVPVVLCMVGIFTSAYMFVALNLALLIFTSVTVFYYLGTYILQRARVSLSKKYTLTTLMMVLTSAVALVASVGATVGLHYAGVGTLGTHVIGFVEARILDTNTQEIVKDLLVEFIIQAVLMFCSIALACIVGGLLYNLTQNIIYAGVPTFVFAYSNIILLQRAKEATDFLATASKNLATYEAKLAEAVKDKDITNYTQKIAEIEEKMPAQQVAMIISYVLMGVMVVALIAIGIRALVGLSKNLKENNN